VACDVYVIFIDSEMKKKAVNDCTADSKDHALKEDKPDWESIADHMYEKCGLGKINYDAIEGKVPPMILDIYRRNVGEFGKFTLDHRCIYDLNTQTASTSRTMITPLKHSPNVDSIFSREKFCSPSAPRS
jgi:hypothetical protein